MATLAIAESSMMGDASFKGEDKKGNGEIHMTAMLRAGLITAFVVQTYLRDGHWTACDTPIWPGQGKRACEGSCAAEHIKSYTISSSMRTGGTTAAKLFLDSRNGNFLLDYVQKDLIPALHNGNLVIMDNLRCHKLKAVLRKTKARTADAFLASLPEAFHAVSISNILGWFHESGYPPLH
jgi:hypothetical protein